MFRLLSNGLAAVGLAIVVAFVALTGGSATRPAEAATTGVVLTITSAANCGSISATATVSDSISPVPATSVTFTSSNGGTATATTSAGVASATLTGASTVYGSVTVTATAGGFSDTKAATCGTAGGYNPCGYTGCGTYGYCGFFNNYSNCGANSCNNSLYVYSNCGYGTNCGYGSYGCGGSGYGCGGVYSTCTTGCATVYGCGGIYCGGGSTLYGTQYSTNNYNNCANYPGCTNSYGTILNCTATPYVVAGSVASLPGRVSILPSATTTTCGSATSITVKVTDPQGFNVPDGSTVNFTTTLGYISSTDHTIGGTSVTSLTIPPGTTGSARVTATSGGYSADTTINVSCSAGAPAAAAIPAQPSAAAGVAIPQLAQLIPQLAGALGGRPAILPPSTGDAGLLPAE